MKKLLAILLAALMIVSMLAACGSASSSEGSATAEDGKKVITFGLNNDLATIGPRDASNMGSFCVAPMIYQSLFNRDQFASNNLEPQIGKEYSISEDLLTMNVTLYDNVTDSNGNVINADDIVWQFDWMKESGQYEGVYKYLDTVTKISDTEVEFKFKDTKLGIHEDVLCTYYFVDSETYDETTFLTAPVGSGPYIVESFVPSNSVVLVKNENWWQTNNESRKQEQNWDVVNVKIITESAQMPIALETGEIDVGTGIDYSNVSAFFMNSDGTAKDGYNITVYDSQLVRGLCFNLNEASVFADNVALRQAVCYAINNEELVQAVLQGAGTTLKTYGTSVYGDYLDKWDSEDYYDYDPDKARELLAEAGYEEGEVTIRMMSQTNDTFKKAMEMIKSYLSEVGINSEIIQYDAALFTTYRSDFSQWDLLLDNQANSVAMASIWGSFLSNTMYSYNGGTVNMNGINDPELQEKIELVSSIQGHTDENMDLVHNIIKDNVMVYGLYAEQSYVVTRDTVDEVFLSSKLYVIPSACTPAE